MAYYSIYKIIKDIFQTILGRKFFRKILIVAILGLALFPIIFGAYNTSKASSYDIMPLASIYPDNTAHRWIENLGLDDTSQNYIISYRFFTTDGMHAGQFLIPTVMYDYPSWFIYYDDDIDNFVFVNNANSSENINYIMTTSGSTYYWYLSYNFSNTSFTGFTEYVYNEDLGSWDIPSSPVLLTRQKVVSAKYKLKPVNIVLTHACNIHYSTNSSSVAGLDYRQTPFYNNSVTEVPDLTYNSGVFTLNLNGFTNGSVTSQDKIKVTSTLNTVSLIIKNIATPDEDFSNVTNILTNAKIETDEDGNSYIVMPSQYFDFKVSGTYIIGVGSSLQYYTDVGDTSYLSFYTWYLSYYTNYYSFDYWQFVYDANTGTGKLTPIGDPSNPDNPDNPDDNNQAIVDGLGDINNSLQQTNDFLTDGSMSDDGMNIDSDFNVEFSENPNDLITSIVNQWKSVIEKASTDEVITIDIGLPFTDGKITLRSDMVSSIIEGSLLYNIVNVFWLALFGWYFWGIAYRIYIYVSSGEMLANGGSLSNFGKYLLDCNTFIKANMM